MKTELNNPICVQVQINAPLETVWWHWVQPESIICWNFAHHSWFCPRAENDLRVSGRFSYRMEARDGSAGFDFEGTYTSIEHLHQISYTLDDDRRVQLFFSSSDGVTFIHEEFEAEHENTRELQEQGWEAILQSFKAYVEAQKSSYSV